MTFKGTSFSESKLKFWSKFQKKLVKSFFISSVQIRPNNDIDRWKNWLITRPIAYTIIQIKKIFEFFLKRPYTRENWRNIKTTETNKDTFSIIVISSKFEYALAIRHKSAIPMTMLKMAIIIAPIKSGKMKQHFMLKKCLTMTIIFQFWLFLICFCFLFVFFH